MRKRTRPERMLYVYSFLAGGRGEELRKGQLQIIWTSDGGESREGFNSILKRCFLIFQLWRNIPTIIGGMIPGTKFRHLEEQSCLRSPRGKLIFVEAMSNSRGGYP